MLTEQMAQTILAQVGFNELPKVNLIKQSNHVYQIDLTDVTLYLKTYTKDWYGDDVAQTGYCVDHEFAAWKLLQNANLQVPEVIIRDTSCDNPLEMPFIVTKALQGASLTRLNLITDTTRATSILHAVGDYLRRMHTITFPNPGYITSAGLLNPPAPTEWQHRIWTFEAFEKDVQNVWAIDSKKVPSSVLKAVQDFVDKHKSRFQQAYNPPRFVHGDCHAGQFFLYEENSQWYVSGVLDMEVASAGDCEADFFQFCLEMAAYMPAETRWWQAVFDGYGKEPNFDLLKMRMLTNFHQSYAWIWAGTRSEILQHILTADSWHNLFDISPMKP